MSNQGQCLLSHFIPVLYVPCLLAQISGERLQDHWFSVFYIAQSQYWSDLIGAKSKFSLFWEHLQFVGLCVGLLFVFVFPVV